MQELTTEQLHVQASKRYMYKERLQGQLKRIEDELEVLKRELADRAQQSEKETQPSDPDAVTVERFPGES